MDWLKTPIYSAPSHRKISAYGQRRERAGRKDRIEPRPRDRESPSPERRGGGDATTDPHDGSHGMAPPAASVGALGRLVVPHQDRRDDTAAADRRGRARGAGGGGAPAGGACERTSSAAIAADMGGLS